MADLTAPLDVWITAVLAAAAPAERRALTRRIVQDLRASQRQRIAAQKAPDGTPYEPRKPQPQLRQARGRLRRTMFEHLRTARHLQAAATADTAELRIDGASGRIAREHQFGLPGRVNRRGLTIRYPVRELLGCTDDERDRILQTVLDHLTPD